MTLAHHIEQLNDSRTRTVSKLETLEKERERLLGRLEGIDLAIASAEALREEELEVLRRGREAAGAPITLDVGDAFDELGAPAMGEVIELRPSQGLSDGPRAQTGSQSGESSDELTDPFSRHDGPLPSERPGPRSRKRKRRAR